MYKKTKKKCQKERENYKNLQLKIAFWMDEKFNTILKSKKTFRKKQINIELLHEKALRMIKKSKTLSAFKKCMK
jgi:hypothetical protein